MMIITFNETIRRAMRVLTIAIVVGLSGCSTARLYDGPPLPRDKIGVLSMPSNLRLWDNFDYIVVNSIDGQTDPKWSDPDSNCTTFELSPGEHSIVVEYLREQKNATSDGNSIRKWRTGFLSGGTQAIPLDIEAGHKYTFRGGVRAVKYNIFSFSGSKPAVEINPRWTYIRVTDTATGKVVFEKVFEQ